MSIINPAELTPLTIHEFKLFAPARVNQVNTLAYLDTGANLVTVSPTLAEGLPRTGTKTVGSAFEQKTFDVVEGIEIDFLGHPYRTSARVHSISEDPLPFNTEITPDAPTLFAQTLIFDFRLLSISFPKQLDTELWIELPAEFMKDTSVCLFQLFSPNGTVWALFDTGAGLSVINSAHTEELGLDLPPAFELEIGKAGEVQPLSTRGLEGESHPIVAMIK